MKPKFYCVKEFALELGVHPNTIRRAIKKGKISALKLGQGKRTIYRIPYSEAARMMEFDLAEYIEMEVRKRLEQ